VKALNSEAIEPSGEVDVLEILEAQCVGCQLCLYYCPEAAIKLRDGKAAINADRCVECGTCRRSNVCPTDAIVENSLAWPRSVRRAFSAVIRVHLETNVPGRGTEEMKTNDVTGRFGPGEVGFSVDVGRPGVGATFVDVERIARAVAAVGVAFETQNPVTQLMTDPTTGTLRDDVKGERVHSCVIEFKADLANLVRVVEALRAVAPQVDTVFSVGCCCRAADDGTITAQAILDRHHIFYRPNGKTNIGLGRPVAAPLRGGTG
jgi:ferredoxin